MYAAKFTPDAAKDIRRLPRNTRNALRKQFRNVILKDPVGCSEELGGPLTGFRSFHFRRYRVICRVFRELSTVAVVGVGEKDERHKAVIYKELEKLVETGKLADAVLTTMRLVSGP